MKRCVYLNGKPLKNGDKIEFRNGRHTLGPAPIWSEWQTGVVTISFERKIPFKNYPLGIDTISIAGAFPLDLPFRDFNQNYNSFSCEEYLVEVRGLTIK